MPPLLVSMSLVTGLVDAFSYLVLGHVFVAKMTGDIVLLGFALVIVIVSTVFGEYGLCKLGWRLASRAGAIEGNAE